MKILKKVAVALIILSGTALSVSGQTLKERIDQSKEIKVYFRNSDIEHNPNTNGDPVSQKLGTGCPGFKETTPLPAEYTDAVKQIVGLLNKGFSTTAFEEGDLTYLSSLPVNSYGELDWQRLGEPLTFFVSSSGSYTVKNLPNTGKENTMEIQSYLYVYSVTAGKLKNLSSTLLAWKQTPAINTKFCDDFAWFVKNFPAVSLAESFKISVEEKTAKFIEKELANYTKAMKKKK
jgi:hypothetical protein